MAGEYTAGAYIGVKPIEEDFGRVALDGYKIEMENHAAELMRRKQKLQEAKAAQEELDRRFKDFETLSSKALNVHAKNFDRELVGQMVADTKVKLADYARRLNDPNLSAAEAAMIKTNMKRMEDNALNFTQGQQRVQEFIDSLRNVDREGGWDSVLSGKSIHSISDAMLSAAEKGMKPGEEGSYYIGDFLRYKLDENDDPVIMVKNSSGGWTAGTIDETLNRWRAEMVPYVDLEESMWSKAGKGVQPRVSEFYRSRPGGIIEVVRQNDWGEIEQMIGNEFDALFPDAESFDKLPKAVQKAIMSGKGSGWNSREDVRNEYIQIGLGRIKDEARRQIRNNPAYLNEYKRFQMNEKAPSEPYTEFLRQVQGLASGDDNMINYFKGKPIGLNVTGEKAGDTKLEYVRLNGDNLTLVVGGGYSKTKDGTASSREEYKFDLTKPEDQKVLINALSTGYNYQKDGGQKVDVSKVGDYYNPGVPIVNGKGGVLDRDTKEKLGAIEKKLGGKKNLSTSSLESIFDDMKGELEKLGYSLDINGSWFGKWGNMEITIEDEKGKAVLKVAEKSGDKVAQKLREFIRGVMGYSTAVGNPDWIRNGSTGSPVTSATQIQRTSQRGGSVPNLNSY